MPNPVVAVQSYDVAIQDEAFDLGLDAVPATYQTNEMMGLVASGWGQRCDDSQPVEFLGLLSDSIARVVSPGDAAGLRVARVRRPLKGFSMKIAAAIPTDVGRSVYSKFSNEVSYSPGVNANMVGSIKRVDSPTVVIVEPMPFNVPVYGGIIQLPAQGAVTISFFNVNKLCEWNGVGNLTATLPPVAFLSAGDFLEFVVTGALALRLTLAGNGADLINGLATFLVNTAQWSSARLVCDGVGWVCVSKI